MKAAAERSSSLFQSPTFDSAEILLDPREYDRIRKTCVFVSNMLNANKKLITKKVEARCEAMADILNLNDAVKLQLSLAAKVHRVGELSLHKKLQDKCFLDMGLDERTAY
jgi:hypothetical protein